MPLIPWFKSVPDLSDAEIEALTAAGSGEEVAQIALDALGRLVSPQSAYAYLWHHDETQYRLVATMTAPGIHEPEPSYSGLMAGSPEPEPVPLTLAAADAPPQPELKTAGGERWLVVPCGGVLLLRARVERSRSAGGGLMDRMKAFARLVGPIASLAARLTASKAEVQRLQASLEASRVAAESVLRPDRSLEVLFRLPLGLLHCTDAGLIETRSDAAPAVLAAAQGKGDEYSKIILAGQAPALLELSGEPDLIEGERLGALADAAVAAVVRIPALQGAVAKGCAYFFFDRVPVLSQYQLAVLTTLGDRFAQVLSSVHLMSETAESYLSTLRSLVTAMDAMAPNSVGHSDRMARYARMIAREMELDEQQVESIALGAYLHDVGMVALDLQLLNTAGRLTPDQFEAVKQHTSLGAELVGIVPSPLPVAPMVAHHHERYDGRGYPHRLAGTEIPLGARIIAVCDLFEAKTTSRANRKPLPFQQALESLQASAGTQLDPEVVATFLRAWKRLRKEREAGLPVAPCWVIKQAPATICGNCPNRRGLAAEACWENPEHLCTRHGDECSHCMVYTEALARAGDRGMHHGA